MSSLPSPPGVEEVIALLANVEALESEASELRPKADRLAEVERLLREERQRLPKLLRAMDVESPGNYGWEARMGWFLAEMRRQLVIGKRKLAVTGRKDDL